MTLYCPRCKIYRPMNEMKEDPKTGIWYCRVKCEQAGDVV